MTQRDADSTALAEHASLSSASPLAVSQPPVGSTEEELEELLNYAPVPPRNSQMLFVRFRLGARLRPMPYSLDEENP
jgi:hypothetical protein